MATTMLYGDISEKDVVNMQDIKKLQDSIKVLIRQVMDSKPTPQEAIQMLEGLLQILPSSKKKDYISSYRHTATIARRVSSSWTSQ